MNHRERVQASIRHEEADRVPLDLGGMRSSGIMAIAYADLRAHLEIDVDPIRVFDAQQQLAYVEAPVRERFGADVLVLDLGMVSGWRGYTLPNGVSARIRADFRTAPDGTGGEYELDRDGRRIRHRPPSSLYFDTIYHPLANATSDADLDRYHWPVLTDDELRRLQVEARRLHDETDYAILGTFGGALLEGGQELRGWDTFMMDLVGDPGFAEALLDRLLASHVRNVELYLQAVGDCIDIIQMGGDMGTQSGPQLRPALYNELFQPRDKVLWRRIHQLRPHVAVFLHSCGGVYDLLPGIVDAGCDILNPVQFSARGMDAGRLKREFGSSLTFWGGGCDTQRVLPFGTPDEVYEHTRAQIEILKPGGGFVFAQVHNIQANVPPANVVAMLEAVRDGGAY